MILFEFLIVILENPAKDERLLEAMKIAVTKAKQLAARAFQEDLIDRLPSVVEKEPLFVCVNVFAENCS